MAEVDFAILSTQRSGSTLLRSSLDSHPQIKCFGEIFLPSYKEEHAFNDYLKANAVSSAVALLRRRTYVYDFLDDLYASYPDFAVGFKFMYGQSRYWPYRFPMVMPYIRRRNVRLIHLVRNNTFDVCLSRQVARSTRSYHLREDRKQPIIEIDVPLLLQEMKMVERARSKWQAILHRFQCLEVSYEEFIQDKKAVSQLILEFLKVDQGFELVSPLKKILKGSKEDFISNYAEVAAALRLSGYGRFLSS